MGISRIWVIISMFFWIKMRKLQPPSRNHPVILLSSAATPPKEGNISASFVLEGKIHFVSHQPSAISHQLSAISKSAISYQPSALCNLQSAISHQQICKSANQQISKSANQQICSLNN